MATNFILLRVNQAKFDTIGLLYKVKNKTKELIGLIIEDEKRKAKVPGKTRIEAGTYELRLRQEGGLYNKYKAKSGIFSKGMINVVDVGAPEGNWEIHESDGDKWEYVLFHNGVDHRDTDGCLLVGTQLIYKDDYSNLQNSFDGFKIVYNKMIDAFDEGKPVYLQVIDEDKIDNLFEEFPKKKKKKKKKTTEDENNEGENALFEDEG
jgi:hypothetical protein